MTPLFLEGYMTNLEKNSLFEVALVWNQPTSEFTNLSFVFTIDLKDYS